MPVGALTIFIHNSGFLVPVIHKGLFQSGHDRRRGGHTLRTTPILDPVILPRLFLRFWPSRHVFQLPPPFIHAE